MGCPRGLYFTILLHIGKEMEVMAKKMQKAFSCILALSLCVSLLSVGAWAEEGSMITTTGSGTAQDPEITITITREDPVQDEETGESRQTNKKEKTWEGT